MLVEIQMMFFKRYIPFKCIITFRKKFMMLTTMITHHDMIKRNDIRN